MNVRQFIGLLLVVLGAISLFLAIAFAYYSEQHYSYLFGTYYTYPYAPYALTPAIIGIVLLVCGILFRVLKVERTGKTQTEKPYLPPPPSSALLR